jgi:hypothetical protein
MQNYDPKRVVVTFKGVRLTGYMSGTFVSAERETQSFSKVVGAGGDVVRVRSRNRSGTATVTLQASSPSNDVLSGFLLEDELLGTGTGPLMVKDLNGTTILEAPEAWIQKPPDVEFGDDESSREWMFDCDELIEYVGGRPSTI